MRSNLKAVAGPLWADLTSRGYLHNRKRDNGISCNFIHIIGERKWDFLLVNKSVKTFRKRTRLNKGHTSKRFYLIL